MDAMYTEPAPVVNIEGETLEQFGVGARLKVEVQSIPCNEPD